MLTKEPSRVETRPAVRFRGRPLHPTTIKVNHWFDSNDHALRANERHDPLTIMRALVGLHASS